MLINITVIIQILGERTDNYSYVRFFSYKKSTCIIYSTYIPIQVGGEGFCLVEKCDSTFPSYMSGRQSLYLSRQKKLPVFQLVSLFVWDIWVPFFFFSIFLPYSFTNCCHWYQEHSMGLSSTFLNVFIIKLGFFLPNCFYLRANYI